MPNVTQLPISPLTAAIKKVKDAFAAAEKADGKANEYLKVRDEARRECAKHILALRELHKELSINEPWKTWSADKLGISYPTIARIMQDYRDPGAADRRRQTERDRLATAPAPVSEIPQPETAPTPEGTSAASVAAPAADPTPDPDPPSATSVAAPPIATAAEPPPASAPALAAEKQAAAYDRWAQKIGKPWRDQIMFLWNSGTEADQQWFWETVKEDFVEVVNDAAR